MKKQNLREIVGEIAAIVPTYVEGKGTASEIYLNDGTVLLDSRSAKRLVYDLAGMLAVDYGSIKRFCNDRLGVINFIPIPLNSKLLFIPAKLRNPIVPKDIATGYVNLFSYESHTQSKEDTRLCSIKMKGNQELLCYMSGKILNNRVIQARLIYKEWKAFYQNPYVKEGDDELYKATKLDLIRQLIG